MSQDQKYTNDRNIGIVSAMSVNMEKDAKGRDRITLTFGPARAGSPDEGTDLKAKLLNLINSCPTEKVKLDIRVEEKTSARGKQFKTGFVMVNKVESPDAQVSYVDKSASNATIQEA